MQNNPPSGPNEPSYTPQPYPPPGQPYYVPGTPPPMAPPPKKRRTWLWIVLGAAAVLVLGCVGLVAIASQGANSAVNSVATFTPATDTGTPTTQGQTTGTWTTTHTFKGNGSKKTASFTVPDNWRIAWTCTPGSFGGTDYNVIITVENTDGSYADSGVNSTCSKSNTHDTTNVPAGGTFILDVISEGDWTINVQVLK